MAIDLPSLRTPALLLDADRLQRNIDNMAARARKHGVALRPHLKTARSVDVLRRLIAAGAIGVTVSTLAEAAAAIDAGADDIVYAVGITPQKLVDVIALQRRGGRVAILCDSVEAANAIGAAACSAGEMLHTFIEVDCGYGRAGVGPQSDLLLDVARALHVGSQTRLAGVLTHGGHSYGCRTVAAVRAVAAQERDAVKTARSRLKSAGLPCPVTSAGSTPTAVHGQDWNGVDELRPGNFVFFDLAQHQIGSCELDDIAVRVLATVIGHQRDASGAVTGATIDAGSLGLSPDASVSDVYGFGLVCGVDGQPIGGPDPANWVRVAKLSQEHGWLRSGDSLFPNEVLAIGTLISVLPAHSCITAAQYDDYHVFGGGLNEKWPRIRGW